MAGLGEALTQTRDSGRKAFIPYVVAGLPGVDAAFLRRMAETGADAIEIGVPFSDPIMDGPVIQEASARALAAGATMEGALRLIREASLPVPVVVMTYLNPVLATGVERFADELRAAGGAGAIVPDLPVDEAGEWIRLSRENGLETVFLAAPNSSPERLRRVAEASCGFVYCVSTFGVTGRHEALARPGEELVKRLRPLTATPLIVGVGISSPELAAQACGFADGVVVGTVLVEPLLRGNGEEALDRARSFRAAVSGTER